MQDSKLKNIRMLTGVTFFLVLATGGVSVLTTRGLNREIESTIHTKDIMELSDELYSSVLEAESNLRGYALTGEKRFIEDFTRGKIQTGILADSLDALTADNSTQQHNIALLKEYIRYRTKLLDNLLQSYAHYQVGDTAVAALVRKGKISTVQIKARINDINNHERVLLQQRSSGVTRYLNILPAILVFTTLTGIGAGLLTLYSLYQYRISKQQADRRINDFQQQLQDQIQRLNTSNRELEQFAYVASHDLQEPLRKISAFGELMNEQYKDKLQGEGEVYLERITNSSHRMRSLITDLLNYSRVSRNTLSEKVNLNAVLATVREDLELTINEKHAQIKHNKLPVVIGNNSEFSQLFQNLISNSLKFSVANKTPQISVMAESSSNEDLAHLPFRDYNRQYVTIRFSDNGIGFEEEYAEKIFIIFQRLHGKDVYEGTGIGLAICKKIAEKYGGTIYAVSKPGKGAVFNVLLPLPQD